MSQNILADDPITLNIKFMEVTEAEASVKNVSRSIIERIDILSCADDFMESCVLEIRPGTGGEEAMNFCAELLSMYEAFFELRNTTYQIMNLQENGNRHTIRVPN